MSHRARNRTTPASEQAAEWLIDLEEGDVDAEHRRAFLAWLKQSPVHIKEFLHIAALKIELAGNERLTETIDELVEAAQSEVVELAADQAGGAVAVEPIEQPGRPILQWLGAAAVALIVTGGGWLWLSQSAGTAGQSYLTEVGEQRSIALEDGSMITLNTSSEMRVSFREDERHVTLLTGEALFEVAKDPARPFRVEAGPMALTVIGTQFNVYRQTERTILTVVEGAVGVSAAEAPLEIASSSSMEPALTATAGDRVAVAASGDITKASEPDVSRVTAWTERKLIFNDRPLAEVVEEFNRYNHLPLRVDDPVLSRRPITGVFNAHDTDVIAAFLSNQPGVRVERSADAIRVTRTDR